MKKVVLVRGVSFLEGDNLLIFYYLSASEIWSDKKGGLRSEGPYKRGTI